MIVEMHCHTREHSSCSRASAADLVHHAQTAGVQAIIFTDHEYLWTDQEIDQLRATSSLPEHILIMAGQEVRTRDFGDILVYGATESIPRGIDIATLRSRWPNAALIWAHPYRGNRRPTDEKLLDDHLDGIEIFSSNHDAEASAHALHDWHRLGFIAIAGTDAHNPTSSGAYPTVFDNDVQSMEELVFEIQAGRCKPYVKEAPASGTSDTNVLEVSIGPRQSVKQKDIIIKTYKNEEAWAEGERSARIISEISQHIGMKEFRVPKPLGAAHDHLALVEERLEGVTLYDHLVSSTIEEAEDALKRAARWLARLHNCRLRITPVDEFMQIEPERLKWYLSGMRNDNHPHLARAEKILSHVLELERSMFQNEAKHLVQGHGDFHPKNIFIGQDSHGPFAGAIDFNSSFVLHPAFDVGTFMAQYMNQFYNQTELKKNVPIDVFLEEYYKHSTFIGPHFMSYALVCKARCCLSIIYYLVKIGLGESENFWFVLVEAEKSLVHSTISRN